MIDDNYIINYYFDIQGRVSGSRVSYLMKHKELEDYTYLTNRYSDSSCIRETLLRIFTHTEIRPVCRHCGAPVKFIGGKKSRMFKRTCSKECAYASSRSKLIRDTYKHKTGYDNPSQNPKVKKQKEVTSFEHFGVRHHMLLQEFKDKIFDVKFKNHGDGNYNNMPQNIKTCNERYGVDYVLQKGAPGRIHSEETCNKLYGGLTPFSSKTVQQKAHNTIRKNHNGKLPLECPEIFEAMKQHNLEKWGNIWWQCTDEGHRVLKERLSDPLIQAQIRDTKIKNGTIGNKSGQEDEIFRLLSIFYGEGNVERQYNKPEYPYDCDFYITPLNLRIEYNGYCTHGYHPYDESNENDQIRLKELEEKNTSFSLNSKHIWVHKDPMKRQCAKDNNLNFLELWPDTWKEIKRLDNDEDKIQVLVNKINDYFKS